MTNFVFIYILLILTVRISKTFLGLEIPIFLIFPGDFTKYNMFLDQHPCLSWNNIPIKTLKQSIILTDQSSNQCMFLIILWTWSHWSVQIQIDSVIFIWTPDSGSLWETDSDSADEDSSSLKWNFSVQCCDSVKLSLSLSLAYIHSPVFWIIALKYACNCSRNTTENRLLDAIIFITVFSIYSERFYSLGHWFHH